MSLTLQEKKIFLLWDGKMFLFPGKRWKEENKEKEGVQVQGNSGVRRASVVWRWGEWMAVTETESFDLQGRETNSG